jgi:ATP-dependent DNA ligase
MLAEQTPAMFIAFDLLARGDRDLQPEPFSERRAQLVELLQGVPDPVHVTRTTDDPDLARRWLAEFEGAGLDGVVAKPLAQSYSPNKRSMFKIKHARTADVVALGYRVHKSGRGVGSLLVGLYGDEGRLMNVGGVAAWSDKRRLELVDELAPLVERDEQGGAVTGETDRSRFSGSKDVSFVRLRPEKVLEVRYDQLEGSRFRHTVQFERWRPDREARSCTFDQLETVSAYDLGDVLD